MWSHSMRSKAQHCRTGPQGLDNHIKLTNPSANTHNITCKEIALCTWPYFSSPFNQMPLKLVLSVQQSRPPPSRLLSLYHLHQTPSCPSYPQSIPQEQTHPLLEPPMGNNTVSTSAASHANSAPAAPIFMAVPCVMTPTMALLSWHKDFDPWRHPWAKTSNKLYLRFNKIIESCGQCYIFTLLRQAKWI